MATSLDAMRALTGEGDSPGVDLVEVGMPYSDPMMDGVTIQRAGTRALERGVRTRDAFAAVEAVAATGTPAVVMTYWNLIEHYGPTRFARDLAAAGGAGRDHPGSDPGRGGGVAGRLRRARPGPDLPGLAVLDRRAAGRTVAACRGWVYATSVMGVTGARAADLVGGARAGAPGSGPPTRTRWSGSAWACPTGPRPREVTAYADAVIVGSALVKTLLDAEDAGTPDDLGRLRSVVADLADGVRAGRPAGLPADGWPAAGRELTIGV